MKNNISALITPFNEKEEINIEALNQLIDFQVRNGINEFWILGTSGEFNMLNLDEKVLLVSKAREVIKGKIYAGVNENSSRNSLFLGKKFYDIGVDYIFSIPPFYHKPNEKGLISYFSDLRKIDLPIYLYNIPSYIGFNVSINVIEKLIEDGILDGMKYTTTDFVSFLNYLINLKELNKQFKIFIGEDRVILPAIINGADGSVSGVSNVIPELVSSLYNEFEKGNLLKAVEIQRIIIKLANVIYLGDFPSGIKTGLKYRGINVGSVRRPLMEDVRMESEIYTTLKDLGF